MNKTNIKVTLEYIGAFTRSDVQEYRIAKIVGAPTIEVQADSDDLSLQRYQVTRLGNIINEKQATELGDRVEITTIAAAKLGRLTR